MPADQRLFGLTRDPLRLLALAAVALTGLLSLPASAEAERFVFVLRGGGRIEGEWLNAGQQPLRRYEVRTAAGGRMVLDASLVERVQRCPAALVEYRRLAPTVADTVQQQWWLAEWCRQHKLARQRKIHLQRILELDPNHADARHALGYYQQHGQWVRRDDWMSQHGFVKYRGQWKLPQEVQLAEEQRQREEAERKWLKRLPALVRQLQADKTGEARRQLLAIRDPHAVRAVQQLLSKGNRPAQLLAVQLLEQIGSPDAIKTLVAVALISNDVEVMDAAQQALVRRQSPLAVPMSIEALKSANNRVVNRAAELLSQLKAREAIAPLIEALVTTHQVELTSGPVTAAQSYAVGMAGVAAAGQAGCCTASAGGGFIGGVMTTGMQMSQGNQRRVVSRQFPNQQVLDALVQLSGGTNLGFDQQAWRNWLALHRNSQQMDVQLRGQD